MSLNYKVLWVDDSPDWVDSMEGRVLGEAEDIGLNCSIEKLQNGQDAIVKICSRAYDLVLLDFKMPGKNGNEVINEVQSTSSLTEIIFYSEEPPEPLGSGEVLACDRRSLFETVVEEMKSAYQRFKDLRVMRGRVIAASIDIENLLDQLIVNYTKNGENDLLKSKVIDRGLLDFQKKIDILILILKDEIEIRGGEQENLKKYLAVLKTFCKEVVDHRNILAHSISSKSVNGVVSLKGLNKRTKEIFFGDDWLNTIRDDIDKHKENLYHLAGEIS